MYENPAGASQRVVTAGERDGVPTRTIGGSRRYATTVEDLWDALTNVERLARWMGPLHGDLRLGGRYQLEGNAGGTITVCQEPRSFAVTWEFGGSVSWVRVRLEADGGHTVLRLEHEMPADEASEAHWEQYGPGATGIGWDLATVGLHHHLATGGAAPAEADWTTSDAGRAFLVDSAAAWAVAHIASGADAAVAHAMADRCAAAYTGG